MTNEGWLRSCARGSGDKTESPSFYNPKLASSPDSFSLCLLLVMG